MPQVTVVCPAYNRGPAIVPTIESVLAQSLTDWEMIVASDGSDDDTDEVVAQAAEREPRLRLLRTPRFGFPSGPCNVAARQARSDILTYIPHDDLWEPHHLAVLMSAMDRGAQVAYTRGRKLDTDGRVLELTPMLNQYWHPELQLMSVLFEPVRAAYRAELVEQVGGWRESPVGLEDWDLWLRLADAGVRFTPLADVTVRIVYDPRTRQHSLPCPHSVELARFPDGRSARRSYRALTDRRLADRYRAAARSDMHRWYGRLFTRDELAMPARWQGDRHRLRAAVDNSLHGLDESLWSLLRIERDGDAHVLASAVATQVAEHAARIATTYREVMPDTCAFIAEVVAAQATRETVPAATPAPG